MSSRLLPGLLACLFASLSAACAQTGERPLFVKPPQLQNAPMPAPAPPPAVGVPVPSAPAVPAPVRPAPVRPAPVRPAPVRPAPGQVAPAVPVRGASGVVPSPASGGRPASTAGRVLPAAPVKLRLMPAWTGQFLVRPREVAPFNPLGLPLGTAPVW